MVVLVRCRNARIASSSGAKNVPLRPLRDVGHPNLIVMCVMIMITIHPPTITDILACHEQTLVQCGVCTAASQSIQHAVAHGWAPWWQWKGVEKRKGGWCGSRNCIHVGHCRQQWCIACDIHCLSACAASWLAALAERHQRVVGASQCKGT